jgi:hypothetical protein
MFHVFYKLILTRHHGGVPTPNVAKKRNWGSVKIPNFKSQMRKHGLGVWRLMFLWSLEFGAFI